MGITIDKVGGLGAAHAPDFSAMSVINLTSNKDDWNPSTDTLGWSITTSGNRNITGIVAPNEQKSYWFHNASGQDIKFKYNDSGSLLANRFATPDQSDYTVKPNAVIGITYNTLINRWMILSETKD